MSTNNVSLNPKEKQLMKAILEDNRQTLHRYTLSEPYKALPNEAKLAIVLHEKNELALLKKLYPNEYRWTQ